MGLDIQYLLVLQKLREATGGVFDEVMNGISKFAVDVLPLLPFVIFWCFSRKWGYRSIITCWFGELLNGIVKLTVCAYRPWIRSDLIEPAGDSKVAASGYSFPSGHTMLGTAVYGTMTVWQWKKNRWISWMCLAFMLLTGFSRNFLGVHTPQDVIVGMAESWLVILLVGKLMEKLTDNRFADKMSIALAVFAIASLVYVMFKSYPMDYVEGKLLVDPVSMMKDHFKAVGGILGLVAGNLIERHKLHYEIPKGHEKLPLLTAIGAGILFAWTEYFSKATVRVWLGTNWGALVGGFLTVFFGLVIWPAVIKKACRSDN